MSTTQSRHGATSARETGNGWEVAIVGPNRLLNELLCSLLDGTASLHGCCHPALSELERLPGAPGLCLLDWQDPSVKEHFHDPCRKPSWPAARTALFNIGADETGVAESALQREIFGVFFQNDPPGLVIKGITAMLKGEPWFPRQVLARKALASANHGFALPAGLTRREAEILVMIAGGATNAGIAESLCISVHTVKTHLTHIFRKINVPNRLQAALWAAQHL